MVLGLSLNDLSKASAAYNNAAYNNIDYSGSFSNVLTTKISQRPPLELSSPLMFNSINNGVARVGFAQAQAQAQSSNQTLLQSQTSNKSYATSKAYRAQSPFNYFLDEEKSIEAPLRFRI